MKFSIYIWFYTLFLFVNTHLWSVNKSNAGRYDSTFVKMHQPSKVQEQEVFSEVNLDFAKKVEDTEIGFWDKIWDWLLNSIFGKADYDDKITMQKIVMWILVIAGVTVVIWLLTRTEFTSFLKGNTRNAAFNFSDVEDIANVDFDEKILKAYQERDFRVAVRWLYLKQLFALNQKGTIIYQPYKTNIDYSLELTKMPYQKHFMELSRIYDYVWYGQYAISESDYQLFEANFKKFETSINV
ncbi:MAG: hypothetical protein V4580_15425 [Bacteroidota bacterium]